MRDSNRRQEKTGPRTTIAEKVDNAHESNPKMQPERGFFYTHSYSDNRYYVNPPLVLVAGGSRQLPSLWAVITFCAAGVILSPPVLFPIGVRLNIRGFTEYL